MAEAISAKTAFLLARDIYFVSKWLHATVKVASQRDAHLEQLRKQFSAQAGLIAAFSQMFLTDLPEDDPQAQMWLPQVKLIYDELHNIFGGDWAKLALKYDQEYRDFSLLYLQQLESDHGFEVPSTDYSWRIEDVSDHEEISAASTGSAVVVSGASTHQAHPARSAVNGTTKFFNFKSWMQSLNDAKSRFIFAIRDQKRFENTLRSMTILTKDLQSMVPMVTFLHPRFRELQAQATEYLTSRDMLFAADRLGVPNHLAIGEIARVTEVDDTEVSVSDHQRRLESLTINVEHLRCTRLEPALCNMLSAGTWTDLDNVSQPVLVEYKGWDAADPPRLVAERRKEINSLLHVLALAKAPFYPNLLTLRGYEDQEADRRYAFVFDYPADSLHEQPLVLQDIIGGSALVHGADDLEQRFAMALEIAKSLAALHAVGWVHESVCSDSIVIFKNANSIPVFEKPYLVNFEFSRTAGGTTKYQSAAVEKRQLYQHPQRWGDHPCRYQIKHDLFSLGVILLEIGLWKTAENMMRSAPQSSMETEGQPTFTRHRELFLAVARSKLKKAMGTHYLQAVVSLLSDSASGEELGSRDALQRIIEVIRICRRFE